MANVESIRFVCGPSTSRAVPPAGLVAVAADMAADSVADSAVAGPEVTSVADISVAAALVLDFSVKIIKS